MKRTDEFGKTIDNKYTKGDKEAGIPATRLGDDEMNNIQEELCYIVEQNGIVLDGVDTTQVYQGIQKMIDNANKAIIITAETFEGTVVDGNAVRLDAVNSRWAKAVDDGTASALMLGFADVTNARVFLAGETTSLFSGLTGGARYYLSGSTPGAISTTPGPGRVMVGIAKNAAGMIIDVDADDQAAVVIPSVTFEGTVVDRDAVYWDSANSRFAKALADGSATARMVGFADVPGKRVILSGVIGGFSSLTSGALYYLSPTTAGAITTSKPDVSIVLVGVAQSATQVIVDVDIHADTGFTTGDVKLTLKNAADVGWVIMDDGTIGSALSSATTRANDDTEALFKLLWNNISDTYAPVSGGRGLSAQADFDADKTITLPKTLGRALAVAGSGAALTARALGENLGEETHTLTEGEMPAHVHSGPSHTHPVGINSVNGVTQGSAGIYGTTGANDTTINSNAGGTGDTGSKGGGSAHNNMQPTSFLNVMIKL